MHKKILILMGSAWSISGFSQTTNLTDSYQPPQTVMNVEVRMLPGFHADSKNIYYNNGAAFVAKYKNYEPNNPDPVITDPPVAYSPASGENYIYTRTYLAPVTTSNNYAPQVQSITYFDGLGRPKQNIAIKSTPSGNDLVTPIIYDGFGRQVQDYLPLPQSGSSNGAIYLQDPQSDPPVSNPVLPVIFPGETTFYSKKVLESSPLDRIQQQVQVGNAWSSKPVAFGYETNTATEVKKFVTTTTWPNNATSSVLTQSGNYGAAQLYKNTVTDEDQNTTIEFKNGEGQTLLVRKNDGTKDSDTYYVYNEYNQLAFVIQPEAAAKTSLTQTDLDELCFQYRYDGRNRLAEKKIPGKGWEYLVYDNQDRLVMTQDANMGTDRQWLFTKYDQFGRVAYTGIYTSSQDYGSIGRNYEQGQVNGKGSNNVTRTASSGFTSSGLIVYYDNLTANNYPNTITKLLSVNYYDTYPTDTPNLSTLNFGQTFISDTATNSINTKGLPTASYINNVETNGWTKGYSYYDGKGRAIATYSRNHLGGYTQTESYLDFAGVVQKTETRHKRKSADAELVVREEFGYDHQNRLLTHTHEVVGKTPKELLVENHYNEIGQLDWKKVGGVSGSYLQKVDLSYNIRGWMTGINSADIAYSPSDESHVLNNGKLFGYNIRYNDPNNPSLGTAKYNGNIAEIDWIYKDNPLKRYGYQYDRLNRLLKGNYQDPGSTVPETHINDEALTYDLNGNIKTLVRNGKHGKYYTPVVVDDLGYQYIGNRVTNITDATNNSSGYEGGGQTMTYDDNGNMTSMPDKNISAIAYNFLNLPKQIDQNANVTNYYYRADGVKVRKRFVLTNSSGTKTINTEYLDGFQYSTPNTDPLRKALEEPDDATMAASTAGEEEAFAPDLEREVVAVVDPGTPEVENMVLSFFPTSEGYYDYENFRYIYQYKDHLGNVRVSYVKNGNDLEIRDRNDYYPFGMSFLKPFGQVSLYDPMAIPYNYKYNGKELQETGMYDYGARMYMPDIGRWGVVDPLAETTPSWSPYTYGFNNPIRFIDPTGMANEDFVQRKDGSIYWDNKANDQATTKSGDTYLGKNLSLTFNSYIADNYDGPLGSLPEGDKLTTTINLSAQENDAGELTGLSATKTTEMGKTFGMFEGRDFYPGEGGSNNIFTKSGMSINYEQHASVPGFEESGLNAMGFKIVDVSQKLNISFDKKSGNLSVDAYTNIFPSATLKLNNTGTTLMNYKQPSFVGTHTAPTIKNATMVRGGVEASVKDFSYYPAKFYKRN